MKKMTIDLDKFLKMYYAKNPYRAILDDLKECEIKPVNCDKCINFGSTCNKCIHNKFASSYFQTEEDK